MSIGGGITFRLATQRGVITSVDIHSTRPLRMSRLFEGRDINEGLRLVPRLFSVCGIAQARTAVKAALSATGQSEAPHIADARDLMVWVETAREHSARILLDWAHHLGRKPSSKVAKLQGLFEQFRLALFAENDGFALQSRVHIDSNRFNEALKGLRALLNEEIFARPSCDWCAINDPDELAQWADENDTVPALMLRHIRSEGLNSLGGSTIGFMPRLDTQTLCDRLTLNGVDHFVAAPEWEGFPRETGCLPRNQAHPLVRALRLRHGNALLTRMVARLIELAGIPDRLETGFANLGLSQAQRCENGLAQTEAARGRLVHHIHTKAGKIDHYRILAPTEWNFHPRGCAAQSLKGMHFENRKALEAQTELLIKAIDPCVGYSLEVSDA